MGTRPFRKSVRSRSLGLPTRLPRDRPAIAAGREEEAVAVLHQAVRERVVRVPVEARREAAALDATAQDAVHAEVERREIERLLRLVAQADDPSPADLAGAAHEVGRVEDAEVAPDGTGAQDVAAVLAQVDPAVQRALDAGMG